MRQSASGPGNGANGGNGGDGGQEALNEPLREVLLPSRLLNGVIPSCLLENFRFWQDERNALTIRGEPVDATASQFFNFHLTIRLGNEGGALVSRNPIGTQLSNAQRTAVSLLRSISRCVEFFSGTNIEHTLISNAIVLCSLSRLVFLSRFFCFLSFALFFFSPSLFRHSPARNRIK